MEELDIQLKKICVDNLELYSTKEESKQLQQCLETLIAEGLGDVQKRVSEKLAAIGKEQESLRHDLTTASHLVNMIQDSDFQH